MVKGMARLRAQWASVLVLLGVGLLLLIVMAISLSHWSESLAAMWDVITNLTGQQARGGISTQVAKVLSILATVVLPILITFLLLLVAVARRQPPSLLLAYGMFSAALVLLLLYTGLVVLTARQEAQVSAGLDRALQHEGSYYAQLVGQPWPGAVR